MDIDFTNAKNEFVKLMAGLKTDDRAEFVAWCKEYCSSTCSEFSQNYVNLRKIAEDIKKLVPTEATFPSEQITHKFLEEEMLEIPTVHVDSFLFDDDDVDELIETGEVAKSYCKDCKSTNIDNCAFISHSVSVYAVEFIFQNMLPDLSNKVLLDVGSRLGPILYGAYYCSKASKIIGVEFNQDMCKLQQHIIEKYNMTDRVEVICDNVCNLPHIVQQANVIILNNVFQCFMPQEDQEKTWRWLRENIRNPGTILITAPRVEETLCSLQTGIDVSTWLRPMDITDPVARIKLTNQEMLPAITKYVVI